MQPINKSQIIAINAAISKKGLAEDKKRIISEASAGRTESSKGLYFSEAQALLKFLNGDADPRQEARDKMVRKLFAMCYDLNWITEKPVIGKSGNMEAKKDFSTVYAWVKKYGYLKKDLKQYQYEELPKLLSQFENGPYHHFLSKK